MPHVDVRHSADLAVDPRLFDWIEAEILRHDPGAGDSKGRAYPAAVFHHTHCHVAVSLLPKPHRDEAFTQALLAALDGGIPRFLGGPCAFSLDLTYSGAAYITRHHTG